MNKLSKLLNIKYPLIQGGMANIADALFAASVSNAGGLGLIAAGGNDANWVKEEIRKCKKLTDKPFGVNVMLKNPEAAKIIDVIIEEKVDVVTTGAGNPNPYIPALKNAGIIVIPVVPSVALAKRVANAGADAVIAEGTEAGGHVGELTTLALIPQVVDAVSIPVIAAGGIGDKRGVLACFALGASGVQVGTILLASTECPIHENYKKLIIEAKDNDTTVTGRSVGAQVRVLKTPMVSEYLKLEKTGSTFEEFEKLTLGSLKKAVINGDIDNGSFMAGQISGLVKEIRPVKEIIEDLFKDIEEYKNTLEIL